MPWPHRAGQAVIYKGRRCLRHHISGGRIGARCRCKTPAPLPAIAIKTYGQKLAAEWQRHSATNTTNFFLMRPPGRVFNDLKNDLMM